MEAIRLPHRIANYARYGWPPATYLRLEVPFVLPDESVALYIDADVLILADLVPLLTTDLQSNFVGAVRDSLSPTVGQAMMADWSELGVDDDREYFNAGVMLMNLEAWREHDISKRCHACLLDYPNYFSHPDQDAINYVLRDSWLRLDRRWNVFPASALLRIGWLAFEDDGTRQRELLNDEQRAMILHYAGPKPWLRGFPDSHALRLYESFGCMGDTASTTTNRIK
jgi:lipopolysaccharide biosynthesis glycosyltransferase